MNDWSQYSAGWWALTAVLFLGAAKWTRAAIRAKTRQKQLAAQANAVRVETAASWNRGSVERLDVVPLTPEDRELLELSLQQIGKRLRTGRLTSTHLVRVVFAAAREVNDRLNCCTEHVLEEALKAAAESDARLASGRARGPLDGIPVSIKDCFIQAGCFATSGTAVRCGARHREDGTVVAAFREAGAIPLVRTNVPQSLMFPESTNNIWGATSNPWGLGRTAGGSSGGEGALIAARGSLVGLGTDIGGSIRIPAAFTGIVGFKPTPHRMPGSGTALPRKEGFNGNEGIRATAGPMGRSVADCAEVMRVFLSDAIYSRDALTPISPWREADFADQRPLRVGVMAHDGFFPPCSANARALETAVSALRETGHTVHDFVPPDPRKALAAYFGIMSADGSLRCFVEGLDGEALHPMYATLHRIARFPRPLRRVLSALLRWTGQGRLASVAEVGYAKSAYELWQTWIVAKQRYQQAFIRAWREADIDVLLTPAGPLPAFQHGMCKDLTISLSYWILFNLLHFPAGVVPVTVARAGETDYSRVPGPRDRTFRIASTVVAGSTGMPAGVQVAALPHRDETCLRGMRAVEQAVPFERRPGVCASRK